MQTIQEVGQVMHLLQCPVRRDSGAAAELSAFIAHAIKANSNNTAAGSLLYVDARELLASGAVMAIERDFSSDISEVQAVAVANPTPDGREVVLRSVAKRPGAPALSPRMAVAKVIVAAHELWPTLNPCCFIRRFPEHFRDEKGRLVLVNPASWALFEQFGFVYHETVLGSIDGPWNRHLRATAEKPWLNTYQAVKMVGGPETLRIAKLLLADVSIDSLPELTRTQP